MLPADATSLFQQTFAFSPHDADASDFCLVDRAGMVVAASSSHGAAPAGDSSLHYLELLPGIAAADQDDANLAMAGIEAVITRQLADFCLEFPSAGTSGPRHCFLRATPCIGNPALIALVLADITGRRPSAVASALAEQPFAPAALLAELQTLYGAQAAQQKLTLRSQCLFNNEQQVYRGEVRRLLRMLGKLVGNALAFTRIGQISMAVTEQERVGEYSPGLRFSVRDTGIGMPHQQRDALLTAFAEPAVGSDTPASGLVAVQQMTESMGGTLGVVSTPGQGSAFWVDLPLVRVGMAEAATLNTPPDDAARLILIVEDIPVNAKLLGMQLGKLGYRCAYASDGQEAVDMVSNGSVPDLIFMDCHMPVMDGFAATREIRAWEKTQGRRPLPIVALTASSLESDRQHSMAVGMTGFLSKPVSRQQLSDVLALHLPATPPTNAALPTAAPWQVDEMLAITPVINLPLALERHDGDLTGYLAFAAGLPKQIAADWQLIEDALCDPASAATTLGKTCQHLKGALGQLGAERAKSACQELEAAAGRTAIASYRSYQQELAAALSELTPALNNLLAKR